DSAQRGQNGLVSFVESVVGLCTQALDAVCIAKKPSCRLELFVLARLELRAVDFSDLKCDEFRARRLLALAGEEPLTFGADLEPVCESARDFAAFRVGAGKFIQEIQMRRRIEQQLMFMLAVQIDEPGAEVTKRPARCEGA